MYSISVALFRSPPRLLLLFTFENFPHKHATSLGEFFGLKLPTHTDDGVAAAAVAAAAVATAADASAAVVVTVVTVAVDADLLLVGTAVACYSFGCFL